MFHILSHCLVPNVVKNQDIQCGNTDPMEAICTNWGVVEKLDLLAGAPKKKQKKDGI
jgi:hypothetical protein